MPKRIKGSEKQKFGYAVYTIFIDPGAVGANTNIPLPDWAKGAQDMLQCVVGRIYDGTTVGSITEQSVQPRGSTLTTGQACLWDDDNIRLGDATTAYHWIMVTLIYKSFTIEI